MSLRLSLQPFAMLCWWGAAPEDASVAAVCPGDKHRHVSPAGSQLGEWRNLPRTFAGSGVSQVLPGSHSLLPLCECEGSVPVSWHEKRMGLTLLWNREPGVAAGAGAGARAIPWSQHQQPAPALVLEAFLRALCNVVLTPSLLLCKPPP